MSTNIEMGEFELAAVKFSRLTKRGVLLGLSWPQVTALTIAVAAFTASLYLGGQALLWTSPIWLVGVGAAFVPVGGRKLVEWFPVWAHWMVRRHAQQTSFRRRIMRPRPAGMLALPGDASSLRQFVCPDDGVVMVHDPHAHTLTAVVEVSHPSFVLLDPGEQERRVQAWGRVLSTVCRSNRVYRLQVLERTVPDSGSGLAAWWKEQGTDDGSWVARTYRELIERAGPTGERHLTTISLSLDMKAAGKAIRSAGGGVRGASEVLRQEMRTLVTALRAADLQPGQWFSPGNLAVVLRSAYDPQVAATLERHGSVGQELSTAGPVAVDESWDMVRSDSAFHAVLWVSEWPRSMVYPGFLSPILLSTGVRRAFSLVYNPVRSDQAARDIRRKKTEYISDAAQRQKIGQIEDASQHAEYQDVLQQEADLTSGHGVLRYTGLLAVSAPTRESLESAVASIEQAAIQASLETRRLVGVQAQAFVAAALPLCRGL